MEKSGQRFFVDLPIGRVPRIASAGSPLHNRAMSSQFPIAVPVQLPADVRVAIVATRWNAAVVDELLRGCVERLAERGITADRIAIHRVPGAFELPVTAKLLAKT